MLEWWISIPFTIERHTLRRGEEAEVSESREKEEEGGEEEIRMLRHYLRRALSP